MSEGWIFNIQRFCIEDGPGIRTTVFFKGCPLRCLYCHNPDTWDPKQSGKYLLSPEELLEEVFRYKSFIAKGGVTVTGGEPLLQPEFLFEFYSLCKENGIHTALDTSGAIFTQAVQKVYDIVDLVLLDVKSIDPNQHKELTGVRIDNTLQTLNYLEEKNKPTWVRHVIVPGWTDDDLLLKKTADYLVPYRCIEKVELLPYHDMGTRKYEQLGMEYRLKNTLPLSKERLENVRTIFREAGLRVG